MNRLIGFYLLLIFFDIKAQQNIRGDFTFYPELNESDQIYIEVRVFIEAEEVSSKVITSFPSNFSLNVVNEDSKPIYFKIEVSDPKNYSTNVIPWKYNPLNRYIPLRHIEA